MAVAIVSALSHTHSRVLKAAAASAIQGVPSRQQAGRLSEHGMRRRTKKTRSGGNTAALHAATQGVAQPKVDVIMHCTQNLK